MIDDDYDFGERVRESMKERQDFIDHPEKFPYYVMGMVRYPSNTCYKYGVTNIPVHWDESL